MIAVSIAHVRRLTADVFIDRGCEPDIANDLADHLVEADRCGFSSHGLSLIPKYLQDIENGDVNPAGRPELKRSEGTLLQFDGHKGFGQHIGRVVVQHGITEAKRHGYNIITLSNAHHLGRLGHYGSMAADVGMALLLFSNVMGREPTVAPWGGAAARLATNPLCFAWPMPAGHEPVVVDFATSSMALNRARVQALQHKKVEPGALIDNEGCPSDDPSVMFREPTGALLPFGGNKGFGLALMIELMAGVLTGGGTIQPEHPRSGSPTNNLFALVIDPAYFCDLAWSRAESTAFLDYIMTTRTQPGIDRVIYAGVPEAERRRQQVTTLFLSDEVWATVAQSFKQAGKDPVKVQLDQAHLQKLC